MYHIELVAKSEFPAFYLFEAIIINSLPRRFFRNQHFFSDFLASWCQNNFHTERASANKKKNIAKI